MSKRETYIQRYEASREKMREIVKLAEENQVIYEPWRMKEVLDHLTGWDDAIIASITSLLKGEAPATPEAHGNDAYNKATVSTREALPYALSQREWEASRVELLRLLRVMSEEQLHQPFALPWGSEGTIETVVEIFSTHEEEHAQEIGEIIRRGRQPREAAGGL